MSLARTRPAAAAGDAAGTVEPRPSRVPVLDPDAVDLPCGSPSAQLLAVPFPHRIQADMAALADREQRTVVRYRAVTDRTTMEVR